MSTLQLGTVQSNTTSPPVVTNSGGTQIGTFCRAWVNFNGTGTVAIRASFNVTSITDNGVGDYTINFTTAMPDANYSVVATTTGSDTGSGSPRTAAANAARNATTGSFLFLVFAVDSTNTFQDPVVAGVAIFR
jgi:hypothetical protein